MSGEKDRGVCWKEDLKVEERIDLVRNDIDSFYGGTIFESNR